MSLRGRIQIIFRDFTGFRGKYTPQLIQAAQYEAAKAGVVFLYPKLVRNTPVGSTALLRQSTLLRRLSSILSTLMVAPLGR